MSGMVGVQAPFSEKDRCRALSERRWVKPYWVCPTSIIEEMVTAFPEAEQTEGFKKRLAEVRSISKKATQTTSDFSLEHFGNGKELMPFQRAGLEFIEATNGNCLVADEPGLGKTIEALAYLALHPEQRPAVIVCPASLKLNWQREAEMWLETGDRIEIVNGGKAKSLSGDIVVINYDILKKWLPTLIDFNPKVLIYDESHYIKSKAAARSKAARELASVVPHRILLTGTPVLNRPAELWHQLQVVKPDEYPDKRFFQWHKKFCNATKNRFGWDFSGASNLDELAQSLKTVMIRRTKEQVLSELPAKRRSAVLIPIDNRKEYDRAEKEFFTWLAEQKGMEAAERASNVEQLAKREYLKQVAIRGKMKAAIEWIKNFLESGEKLIVFGTHRTTIKTLVDEFSDCAVSVIGGMKAEAKDKAVKAFQNDQKIRLFIGNIQAAGQGLTLTAASNVAFLELADGPEMLKQCEDRAHRIGQKDAVNCWYLLAEKTIDGIIIEMVESKRDVIDQITEEKNRQGFDLFEMIENNTSGKSEIVMRIGNMKQYLSFGGGVNSTALLLLLTDHGEEFETIFVNHGGDYPETYAYVDYLRDQGFEITEIIPDVEGYHTIYDYSMKCRILPSFRFRWCTDKFKVRPMLKYIQTPCVEYIGFDYDEQKRTTSLDGKKQYNNKESKEKLPAITYRYPLIDAEMNRDDCINLIKDHGLKVPQKSGCWFCPFMHKLEVRELFLNHRDLYDKALKMEENCMKDGFYIKDKPLPDIAMAHTPPLTGYFGGNNEPKTH